MAEEQEGIRLNEVSILEQLDVREGYKIVFIYDGDDGRLLSGFASQNGVIPDDELKQVVTEQDNFFIEMEVKQIFVPGIKH